MDRDESCSALCGTALSQLNAVLDSAESCSALCGTALSQLNAVLDSVESCSALCGTALSQLNAVLDNFNVKLTHRNREDEFTRTSWNMKILAFENFNYIPIDEC